MTVAELIPTLSDLDRREKLQVMQFLVTELSNEEGAAVISETMYPIWSPYAAHEAANELLNALDADTARA